MGHLVPKPWFFLAYKSWHGNLMKIFQYCGPLDQWEGWIYLWTNESGAPPAWLGWAGSGRTYPGGGRTETLSTATVTKPSNGNMTL